MQNVKNLIFLFLAFTFTSSAILSSSFSLCVENYESRECDETSETEEKLEANEAEKLFHQEHRRKFLASIIINIDFHYLDISFNDIFIEVTTPPPELS